MRRKVVHEGGREGDGQLMRGRKAREDTRLSRLVSRIRRISIQPSLFLFILCDDALS